MEFITVEQFKEQPEEVQKVFIDWWKPNIGDLFIDLAPNSKKKLIVIEDEGDCIDIELIKSEIIPLLTEGQIRKLIEDKTFSRLQIDYFLSDGGYSIALYYKENEMICNGVFDGLSCDLLQAYWKVACKIAKESSNG